jgi:hypothetical protein
MIVMLHPHSYSLVLAVGLTACGGGGVSSDAPILVTCDLRSATSSPYHGQCQEWRGDIDDDTNMNVEFNALCTSTLGGVVLQTTCPTASVVGVCTEHPSVAQRVILHFYYSDVFSAADAERDCDSEGGSFTVP